MEEKKKHTDLQSVPPTYSVFTVQTALRWRQAVTACLTWSFLPTVETAHYIETTTKHNERNVECSRNEHNVF